MNVEGDAVDRGHASEPLDQVLDVKEHLSLGDRRLQAKGPCRLAFLRHLLQSHEGSRPRPPLRPEALGAEQHDQDQHGGEEQEAGLLHAPKDLGQPDHHTGAEDHPAQASQPSDDDQDQDLRREDEGEARGVDGRDPGGEEGAGQPRPHPAHGVGEELQVEGGHADGLGRVLVFTNGDPASPEPGQR